MKWRSRAWPSASSPCAKVDKSVDKSGAAVIRIGGPSEVAPIANALFVRRRPSLG
jgi:hypothetical protein